MRSMLLAGQTTVAHDTLLWLYPWYQYTAENLLQGRFPWWNPFTHGGEPFYPLLAQLRFFDPISFLVLFLGAQFTTDLLTLFAWDRFARGLVCVLGAYFLLRPWAEHTLTRCSLLPILIFSSFFLSPLRQDAFLGHFIWASLVMILLFRIVYLQDYRWQNWILVGGLIGLNWQSYYFAGTWVFLLLFTVGVWIFQRQLLVNMFSRPGIVFKFAVAGAIVLIMCLPNLVLLLEQDRFVLPARMLDPATKNGPPLPGTQQWEAGPGVVTHNNVIMSYSHVAQTGTSSRIMDFLQIVTPWGSFFVTDKGSESSEAFMYFGFWVYAGALWGLLVGKHPLKGVWLVIGVGSGLLMLGPSGGLHPLLFYFYPPLWFVRHTHGFVLFFSVALLYFYILGCNQLLRQSSWDLIWLSGWREKIRRFVPQDIPPPISKALLAVALFAMAAAINPFDLSKHHIIEKEVLDATVGQAQFVFADNISVKVRVMVQDLVRTGQAFLTLGGVLLLLPIVKGRPWTDPVWTIILFPAGLIGLAFLSRALRPQFPNTLILSGILLGTAWMVWRLRLFLGSVRLFLLLLVSQVMAVFLMHPRWNYLVFLLIVLGIPLTLLQFSFRRAGWPARGVLPYAVFMVLVVDLLGYFSQARGLSDVPRPDTILGIQPIPLASTWAAARTLVTMTGHEARTYGQAMRYPEVMYRTPTVFTPLMDRQDGTPVPAHLMSQDALTQELISGKRWNSYLMLKPYYRLIYADIPGSALRQMFSVGSPLVQFKAKAFRMPDQAGLEFLHSLGAEREANLLEHAVLLTGDTLNGIADSSVEALVNQLDNGRPTSEDTSDFQWQVDGYDYNSLDLNVASRQGGYLYWADGYDIYWKAYVDRSEVPVMRANVAFKSVHLPPGQHIVRFEYFPIWYWIAISIFIGMQASTCLCALLLWWWDTFMSGEIETAKTISAGETASHP